MNFFKFLKGHFNRLQGLLSVSEDKISKKLENNRILSPCLTIYRENVDSAISIFLRIIIIGVILYMVIFLLLLEVEDLEDVKLIDSYILTILGDYKGFVVICSLMDSGMVAFIWFSTRYIYLNFFIGYLGLKRLTDSLEEKFAINMVLFRKPRNWKLIGVLICLVIIIPSSLYLGWNGSNPFCR